MRALRACAACLLDVLLLLWLHQLMCDTVYALSPNSLVPCTCEQESSQRACAARVRRSHLAFAASRRTNARRIRAGGAAFVHTRLRRAANAWRELVHSGASTQGMLRKGVMAWFRVEQRRALNSWMALSGGERARLCLAQMLLSGATVLICDEPTNHLDAESVAWLERFLESFSGTVVAITHDRYFLDRLCTRIVEFDQATLHEYEGGYSAYLVKRAERLEADAKSESARLNTLRRETEWIKRGPPARTTKSKARIGRHQALVDSAPPAASADLEFMIPEGPRLGDFVLRVQEVSKSFGGREVIAPFSFELGPGQRLGTACSGTP